MANPNQSLSNRDLAQRSWPESGLRRPLARRRRGRDHRLEDEKKGRPARDRLCTFAARAARPTWDMIDVFVPAIDEPEIHGVVAVAVAAADSCVARASRFVHNASARARLAACGGRVVRLPYAPRSRATEAIQGVISRPASARRVQELLPATVTRPRKRPAIAGLS
jgi:hypothetical protein